MPTEILRLIYLSVSASTVSLTRHRDTHLIALLLRHLLWHSSRAFCLNTALQALASTAPFRADGRVTLQKQQYYWTESTCIPYLTRFESYLYIYEILRFSRLWPIRVRHTDDRVKMTPPDYVASHLRRQYSLYRTNEEIKSRVNSENAFYHSAKDRWSYSFLPNNIQIRTSRNVILPVVLYGCETRT
jgi:hypothetical protein